MFIIKNSLLFIINLINPVQMRGKGYNMSASRIHKEGTRGTVRSLLFLIIFCFAGMLFVSCSGDEPTEETDDTKEETEEENNLPTITVPDGIVDEGNYTELVPSAAIVTVIATDEEGDTLTYSIQETDPPSPFTIDANTGEITATGIIDYEALSSTSPPYTYELTIQVTDDTGGTPVTDTLTITVNNVNDNAPVITSAPDGDVNEGDYTEAVPSADIVKVIATDEDNDDTLTYSIKETDTPFSIDASTGIITATGIINYADLSPSYAYELTIQVTDGNPPVETNLTITINDVANVLTITVPDRIIDVDEGDYTSIPSVTIVTVTAADDDGNTLIFAIQQPNPPTPFSIDASTGKITATGIINYADLSPSYAYELTIQVTDGKTSVETNLTITINDVANVLTITVPDHIIDVDEGDYTSIPSASIVEVTAMDEDNDTLTYAIQQPNNTPFSIDTNGVITATGMIDYESLSSTSPPYTYELTIQVMATPSGTTTTGLLTITVNNVNDNAPVITSAPDGDVNEGDYTEAVPSATIVKVIATDEDGDTLIYSIMPQGTPFSIDTNGVITATGIIDYESLSSTSPPYTYELTIQVTDDTGRTPVTDTLTITVNNVNDNAPVITSAPDGNVAEGAYSTANPSKSSIVTVTATDEDSDTTLIYSIIPQDTPFSIDANGIITATSDIDYETLSPNYTYELTIEVRDIAGGTPVKDTLTITVNNVNEFPPVITSAPPGDVNEGDYTEAVPSASIVKVIATDEDGDTLIYSIIPQDTPFSIDTSGVITATGMIDYESLSSTSSPYTYELTIEVKDTDGGTPVKDTLTITVNNVNEFPPVITSAPPGDVNEGTYSTASPSANIVTVAATDEDGDTLIFAIQQPNPPTPFSIDANGIITATSDIDYETLSPNYTYELTIEVRDTAGGTPVTDTLTITVTLDWEARLTNRNYNGPNNNRYLHYGSLRNNITLHIGGNIFTFKSNKRIYFYASGEVWSSTLSAEATSIQVGDDDFDFASNEKISFHASGEVGGGILSAEATDITVGNRDNNTFSFAVNELISFHENGEVGVGILSSEATGITVGNNLYDFASNARIHFYETAGVVIQGRLATGSTLYTAGQWIRFYADDGGIAETSSVYNSSWTGERN